MVCVIQKKKRRGETQYEVGAPSLDKSGSCRLERIGVSMGIMTAAGCKGGGGQTFISDSRLLSRGKTQGVRQGDDLEWEKVIPTNPYTKNRGENENQEKQILRHLEKGRE